MLASYAIPAASTSANPGMGHAPTAWERADFPRKAAMTFADSYRDFIGKHKTEREVVEAALAMARARGHKDLLARGGKAGKLAPGTRLYAHIEGKLAAIIVVGRKPLSEGMHLVASHIDSVRLDLKQKPLYADANIAMLETHYYGGLKKYQWLSLPLELRGVVVTRAGKTVKVSIGARADDPVLVIPDVAPHIADLVDREGEEVDAESLDPIIASTPVARPTAGQDPFAAQAAALLKARYGIDVGDLVSAELELVPAGAPRDVGLDRALIGGYGHDDRACAYAALRAVLEPGTPQHTAMVVLVDKEEIGSTGNTGARSNFVRRVTAELVEATGEASTSARVDRVLARSVVFSADVTGAVNPAYARAYERKNASFLGAGLVWDRSGDHAELMAYVRSLFDRAGISHQPSVWTRSTGSEAGGTVLSYFTAHGMRGLDVSIPVLSMHAPFEVLSKADLYEGYRGYRAFLRD